MSNGNTVTVVGNITRDPELRFTPSGQATASITKNERRGPGSDGPGGGGGGGSRPAPAESTAGYSYDEEPF